MSLQTDIYLNYRFNQITESATALFCDEHPPLLQTQPTLTTNIEPYLPPNILRLLHTSPGFIPLPPPRLSKHLSTTFVTSFQGPKHEIVITEELLLCPWPLGLTWAQ